MVDVVSTVSTMFLPFIQRTVVPLCFPHPCLGMLMMLMMLMMVVMMMIIIIFFTTINFMILFIAIIINCYQC